MRVLKAGAVDILHISSVGLMGGMMIPREKRGYARFPQRALKQKKGRPSGTLAKMFSIGIGDNRSDLTSLLDGLGQLTLMHGAGAGGPAGQDLGPLRQETAQLGRVLIVDVLDLVHAEGADLAALPAAGRSLSIAMVHYLL